jgi:bacterial/archaeal transporter family-2 protein
MHSLALSALVAFVVGSVRLAILVVLGSSSAGPLRGLIKVRWWAWTGGVQAVFSILAGIVALPSMSSATIIGAAIFGQLIASLVIDHLAGWFNVPVVPIYTSRIIGVLLLFDDISRGGPDGRVDSCNGRSSQLNFPRPQRSRNSSPTIRRAPASE